MTQINPIFMPFIEAHRYKVAKVMWFNDFGHRHRGDILTSIIQQVT
ncbi:hypothetical protein [Xenorhabdus taiwanensis]